MRRTIDHLKQKQSLPLKAKMLLTKVRMEEFELDHRSIHIKPTNPKRDAILKELKETSCGKIYEKDGVKAYYRNFSS